MTDDVNEIAWAVYQACNYAFMQYLSEPLRRGEAHCRSPTHVHLPKHFEDALDIAITAFRPNEPKMRNGNTLFGGATVVFDAEHFKFEPHNVASTQLALTVEEREAIEWHAKWGRNGGYVSSEDGKWIPDYRETLRALVKRLGATQCTL